MSDEDDDLNTTWNRIRRKVRRDEYEGDDRRSPDRRQSPPDMMKFLPLAMAIAGGIYGYAVLNSQVETQARDLMRVEQSHKDWNLSISDRVRAIELHE